MSSDPVALTALVPHRRPMLLLSALTRSGKSDAECRAEIAPDNLFLGPDGRLDRVALLEVMAQCFAAGSGAAQTEGAPGMGYLAGIRDVCIHGDAVVGDVLTIRARSEGGLGDISLVRGEVYCCSRLLAEGRFKIYAPSSGGAAGGGTLMARRVVVVMLFCLAWICLVPPAGVQAAEDGPAADLLEAVARKTKDIQSLSASFQQEKKLSFLEAPLRSVGRFCLVRSNTDGEKGERLLWEYTTPAASGFLYENGAGFLWMKERAALRPVSGQEDVLLKAMAEHILAWVKVDPGRLSALYHMERPDPAVPRLRLIPRQSGAFFSALDVLFAQDLRSVRSLIFVEKNGDSTRLNFDKTRVNAPLPAYCRP